MTDAPLRVEDVVKRYDDVTAIAGVSFELAPGELLALVGPSGCGKSTLLRSIAGLVSIDEGTIRLGGTLVDDGRVRLPPERRSTGLVFQEHALFPHLTVGSNVGFGVRGQSKRDSEDRVAEMLELVSLGGYAERYPHELSGGERQRVALARALAPEPALMLFDEPFASLDHNLRVQLRHDVVAALRATGIAAVFVTHDQHEALAIGDRIAVMRGGSFVQIDTSDAVFHRPANRFVAAFMGAASFLPIDADGSTALGPVELPAGTPDGLMAMARPDDVTFAPAVNGEALVVATEYYGTNWLSHAVLHDEIDVQFSSSHLEPPEVGSRGRLALVEGHHLVPVADTA